MPLRGTNNFLKHAARLKKRFFQHNCRNLAPDSNGDKKVTSLASLSYLAESGNDGVNKFNLLTLGFSQVYRDGGVSSNTMHITNSQPSIEHHCFFTTICGVISKGAVH
jgi:hypothetical protein